MAKRWLVMYARAAQTPTTARVASPFCRRGISHVLPASKLAWRHCRFRFPLATLPPLATPARDSGTDWIRKHLANVIASREAFAVQLHSRVNREGEGMSGGRKIGFSPRGALASPHDSALSTTTLGESSPSICRTLLCVFMLIHYTESCYSSSLFRHCIQRLLDGSASASISGAEGRLRWWGKRWKGESTCGFLFHHHHFPSDSALRMLAEGFHVLSLSPSHSHPSLSLSHLIAVRCCSAFPFLFPFLFFFGINIHSRVFCLMLQLLVALTLLSLFGLLLCATS